MSEQSEQFEGRTIAVFAKEPQPGAVKTRLTGRLDEREAAQFYEAFLADIAATIGSFGSTAGTGPRRLLAYAGDRSHPAFDPYRAEGFDFVEQGRGDLGDRLARVTQRCFERETEQLVIVGTDSPTLQTRHLKAGFDRLAENDVVLGPSFDDGYYLIGLDGPYTTVFQSIDWSTRSVLEQTHRRCRESDLLCELLEFWYDIDDFRDLRRLRFHLLEYFDQRRDTMAPATARMLRQVEERGVFGRDGS